MAKATSSAIGAASSANQPNDFQMWSREWWASSWAITTRTSRSLNGGSSSVFQRITRRVGPRPAANAFGSSVNSSTSSTFTGMSGTPCSRPSRSAAAASRAFRSGSWSGHEVGRDKREQQPEADEHGRAGDPPLVAERARERHHDPDRDADEQEHAAERRASCVTT